MRKIFLTLGFMAAAFAVSCNKESNNPTPAPTKDPVYSDEFPMKGNALSFTKMSMDNKPAAIDIKWSADDKLYAYTGLDRGFEGILYMENIEGKIAFFNLKTDLADETKVRILQSRTTYSEELNLPDVQTQIMADECNWDNLVLYSEIVPLKRTRTEFSLRCPQTMLRFLFSAKEGEKAFGAKISQVSFSNEDADICGSYILDYDGCKARVTSGGKKVTVILENPLVVGSTDKAVWASLLPASLKGKACAVSAKVAYTDGTSATVNATLDGLDLQAGYVHTIRLTTLDGSYTPADKSKPEFTNTKVEYKVNAEDGGWQTGYLTTVDGMNWMDRLNTYTLDRWGGYDGVKPTKILSTNPAGFWRTGELDGRKVMVDPDGNVAILHGVNGVAPDAMREAADQTTLSAYSKRFSSYTQWAQWAGKALADFGFNFYSNNPKRIKELRKYISASDEEYLKCYDGVNQKSHVELVYFLRTFCWDYNSLTTVTFLENKANITTLIFDPGNKTATPGVNNRVKVYPSFPEYAAELAGYAASLYKNDPNFIGYYLDNELKFLDSSIEKLSLKSTLDLPASGSTNPLAYDAAKKWAQDWMKREYKTTTYNSSYENAFRQAVAEEYYRITSEAMRKADPNHLIMGSRLHGSNRTSEQIVKACAKYCDVISINIYHQWVPWESYFVNQVEKWTDKPYLVTEFYIRDINASAQTGEGGGEFVKGHPTRGLWYQNFTRELLDFKKGFKNSVGWEWFQMMDDHTDSKGWNNKGVCSSETFEYYGIMPNMRQMHWNVYQIMDYYMGKSRSQGRAIVDKATWEN